MLQGILPVVYQQGGPNGHIAGLDVYRLVLSNRSMSRPLPCVDVVNITPYLPLLSLLT